MTKICFIVPKAYTFFNALLSKYVGGSERQVYLIGNQLAENEDFDVHFCVADVGQPPKEKFGKIQVWKSFSFKENLFQSIKKLYKSLKSIRADVYMNRSPSTGAFFCMFIVKYLLRKKYGYMISSDCECEKKMYLKLFGAFSYFLMQQVYKKADFIISQSEYQRECFETKKHCRAFTVRNIFSPPNILESKKHYNNNIIWVGRCHPQKKPEAYIGLAKQFPYNQFIMITSQATGQAKYYHKTKQLASAVNNIVFIEYVEPEKIWDYYLSASLYVTTSEVEGFSNTMMEAMWAKCPVLSLHINPDNIIDIYSLGFFARNDETILIEACRELLNNHDKLMKMGQNCHDYILAYHSVNNIELLQKGLNEI